MTTLYKLTDTDHCTFGGCQWGPGVTHTTPGGRMLCTAAWLHAYRDPYLAVLMDPVHGGYGKSAVMWEAEGVIGADDGTEVGCTRLTTVRTIPKPTVTTEQRVRFAILAARGVCDDPAWRAWADRWLSSEDRTRKSALETWDTADLATERCHEEPICPPSEVAAWAAAQAAAWAASEAADGAAGSAAWAAARAAFRASEAASASGSALDLIAIARQACEP